MTTMAEYEAKIDPKVWSHADWLWKLGGEKILDTNTRNRLQAIACLLKFRPDINAPENFRFEVGKTYMSLGGELVTIKGRADTKGYECVFCDKGIHRYNRSDSCGDLGRTTGGKGDCPTNLIPIEVQFPEPINLPKIKASLLSTPREPTLSLPFSVPGLARIRDDVKGHTPGSVHVHRLDRDTALVSRTDLYQKQKFWIAVEKLEGPRR